MPNGVNDKVNDGVNVHVNERQKELLSYLLQDPGYTVTQLSEIMSVSKKTIIQYINFRSSADHNASNLSGGEEDKLLFAAG